MNWKPLFWLSIAFGVVLLGLGVVLGLVGSMVSIDEAFAAKRWFVYGLGSLVSGLVVLTGAGVGGLAARLRPRHPPA